MSSSRRTVLTGAGVINPLGLNTTSFWEALRAGRSGVKAITAFDASALTTRIATAINGFDARSYFPPGPKQKEGRKALKVMARTIQLAVAAAQLALDDARADTSKLDPTRFGVEFGSGLLATELEDIAPAAQLSANCK